MNVLDFAMNMELDGKTYYEKLSTESTEVALKTVFAGLAQDEQKHYEIIQALKAGRLSTVAESTSLEVAQNLFASLTQDKALAGSLKDALDGYQHARKIEADSIRFYEDMAKKEDNPDAVCLILMIANEEKKHYNIMDNLCNFVQAPQYYLAWGEFGNLKEL